jgi:hypothetical protein
VVRQTGALAKGKVHAALRATPRNLLRAGAAGAKGSARGIKNIARQSAQAAAKGAVGRSDAVAEESVSRSVEEVSRQVMDPKALARHVQSAKRLYSKLPAPAAKAKLTGWNAKASKATGRADKAASKALRVEKRASALRADGLGAKNPLLRHEDKHAAKLWKKQKKRAAKTERLLGRGKGARGAIMRVRRGWAGLKRNVFGLKGAAIALVIALSSGLLRAGASSCSSMFTMLTSDIAASSQNSVGSLTGIEAQIATALKAAGFTNAQTAAVMGVIYGESGFDPTAEANFDGSSFPYERAYGLFQFTDAGTSADNLTQTSVLTSFRNWCSDNSRTPSDAAAQVDYFAEIYRKTWSTALHRHGYYAGACPQYADMDCSLESWDTTDDPDAATYMFLACWGRPAAWATRYEVRAEKAEEIYRALVSGSYGTGEEYAASDEQQRAIVDAVYRVASPGSGLCAAWVTNVYRAAGITPPYGNANDMCYSFCHSSDRSELKVGMVIGSPTTVYSRTYGHVGIYVGDGTVVSNLAGTITTQSLDSFIEAQGTLSPVVWGFPSGVSL